MYECANPAPFVSFLRPRYDRDHERKAVGSGEYGFTGFAEVVMGIQPGERLIGGLAVLFLLAGCWSAALAQVGPCAGAVEYTGID